MSLPTRTLASSPDLAQLKRQAKELLKDFAAGNAEAAAEIAGHYRGADAKTFALSDAQLVLARAYGFRSWPSLKAFVDGVTVARWLRGARIHGRGGFAVGRDGQRVAGDRAIGARARRLAA
jgi:hypothetical protein